MSESSAFDSLMTITKRPPIVMVAGQGSWLTDSNGKRYLDFIQGWAVNCLGHAPAVITQALSQQAAQLISPSPAFYNQPAIRLADLLTANSCFERVFFANSGAEANEGAIKLARKWGSLHKQGAYEIITMVNGFHGRTLATMSASGKPHWQGLFEPKVPGFIKVGLNDLEAVTAAISERTVAIMLEPVQGEAGVIPASQLFLQGLRQLADQHQLLLIFDEVQTGMGRLGSLFAYQQAGVEPDIMSLGKGIGGGVPLAALLAKEAVCCFEPGDQGGTYNGNPLMAAVGCAVLEAMLQPGFLEQVRERGVQLANGLRKLSTRHGLGEVRGSGLLQALALPANNGDAVTEAARELGLIINAARPDTLRFMPALNVSADEVDTCLRLLDQVFVAGAEMGCPA
ncbi:acetylornithine transaminase [Trichlorobacter lovleyi]|uniref:Acetylornithine aminotransferase n=1 Tax=Trichlorobacter lovleyi (strain ATCC BAA-1151 / DSM 17278 / SZ) TaxID=398767 RepID=B3E9D7_TRIL1|nr:acetylornithine transaminase [Trichlorobacter lovleyi]ACD93803.1 acetylornithine and succinylornithine aminotransferase [Trichlorobacter lovleyi SZ]